MAADGLSAEQMQEIAARCHAETAFVLVSERSPQGVRLRYFVPQHEMEMCVHATIAAVTLLVRQNMLDGPPAAIETALGLVPVHWTRDVDGLWVSVDQQPPHWHETNPDLAEVAEVLGVPVAAIDTTIGPVQSVSTARPKLLVPLAERGVLHALRPDFEALWSLCDRYQTTGLYPFFLGDGPDGTDAEARQFPRRAGYDEDPATGVAASALVAYLATHVAAHDRTDGWHRATVGQGRAMGRPSAIRAEAFLRAGHVTRTRVQGRATVENGS